ncbi:MAG: outer membrane protein assembly factor BamE domain-containing protein [Candidatus Cyclobacteriaceae bacterium M2_1C_046]
MKNYLPFFLIFFLSCTDKPIEIEGFDQDAWKADEKGCAGQREELAKVLLGNEEKLLGNSSQKISKYLGKPNLTELYTRNQRFYIYYISPGPACSEKFQDTEHDRLTLRFSATDALKEISLYN